MEFENGLEYSLTDFFSWTVLIPDFQRPYCWGDYVYGEKKDKNIVLGFLTTLIDGFIKDKDEDVQLGKIDSYIFPKCNLNLSDGQQRITTLYLLIGYLTKQKNSPFLEHLLTSNDKEPRLKYATDENTLDFVRDLVNNFFIKNKELKVSDIKKQSWYFDEHNNAPSIKSMLEALLTIEKKLGETEIDILEFSKFIALKIKLQYYNVEKCKYGEERFIIINTTGKSNTETENIKPILLGKISQNIGYAEQWEARESWFWKHRKAKEEIADYGVNDFLTWFYQIITKTEKIDLIEKSKEIISKGEQKIIVQLESLNKYFNSLLHLINLLNNEKIQQQFKCFSVKNIDVKSIKDLRDAQKINPDVIQNIILPLLSFMVNISEDKDEVYTFLRRLRKNYFHSIWTERNKDYLHWRYLLNIIENSKTLKECLKYESLSLKITNEDGNEKWFNAEEALKVNLRLINSTIIDKWEDHEDFMGDLTPLFKVCNWSTDFEKNEDYFNSYLDFITPTDELKNEISLIKICSESQASSFSVYPESFTCINRSHNYKIFNKNWFIPIWREFTDKKNNRLITLRKINQLILSSIIKNQNCTDAFLSQIIHTNSSSISQEEIKNFETKRITDSGYWGGFIVASIYYWMYLENIYKNDQNLSIKNGLNQIGLKLFDENNSDKEKKYSFSNIKVGTHYSGGNSLNYNYELMLKINDIQEKEKGIAFEKIDAIMIGLKSKITAH